MSTKFSKRAIGKRPKSISVLVEVGTIKVGTRLANGAIVLASKWATGKAAGQIVLALLPANQFTPFVTWWMNSTYNTFGGDYCETLTGAMESFKGRVS